MATDFFGSNKTVKANDQIVTGELCSLSMGGRVALLQNATASYGRQIMPMFEAGTTTTYYISGNSEGSIEATAAVGKSGFFKNFNSIGNCGKVDKLGFSLGSSGGCAVSASGSLNFTNGLVENVSITLTAGFTAVTNAIRIRVGSMSTN